MILKTATKEIKKRRKGIKEKKRNKKIKKIQMSKRKDAPVKYKKQVYKKPKYTSMPKANLYRKGEMKYFDSSLNNVAIAATNANWAATELDPTADPVANIFTLFAPTQGSGINNRVGRQVYAHSIKITATLFFLSQTAQSTADAGSIVRLILYQDMQTNGAQAQGEDVMQTNATSDAANTNCSFMNVNNFGRFRILKDKHWVLNDPNMAGSPSGMDMVVQGQSRRVKYKVKLNPPVRVHFNATNGGTIADIIDNSFHLIGHATSSALTPRISYQCRVGFKEEN